MKKVKIIAFDLGGVLFSEGKRRAAEVLFQKYGYQKEIIINILKSPKVIDLHKGLISEKEFWSWAQDELPQGYNSQIIKKEWYDGYVLDKEIFNLVRKLKNKYKLVIFSGNVKSRVEYLDNKYHFRKYFDKEIYSYDYCFHKTDKNCVEILIKETKNEPGEIVYIDDNEEIMKFAKEKFGINTIVYQSGKIKELEEKLQNLEVKF